MPQPFTHAILPSEACEGLQWCVHVFLCYWKFVKIIDFNCNQWGLLSLTLTLTSSHFPSCLVALEQWPSDQFLRPCGQQWGWAVRHWPGQQQQLTVHRSDCKPLNSNEWVPSSHQNPKMHYSRPATWRNNVFLMSLKCIFRDRKEKPEHKQKAKCLFKILLYLKYTIMTVIERCFGT